MFRAPSQRVASAHAFGNHGFGMQHDARMPYAQLLANLRPATTDAYAAFPGIRGCQVKMLTGQNCYALLEGEPKATAAPPRCYEPPNRTADDDRYCDRLEDQLKDRAADVRDDSWAAVRWRARCVAGARTCVGPDRARVAFASRRVAELAFVGVTELWSLSHCLFHRLLGGAPDPRDDAATSNRQGGAAAGPDKYRDAAASPFVDVADELLFERVLDRFEADLACVLAERAAPNGDTTRCGAPADRRLHVN